MKANFTLILALFTLLIGNDVMAEGRFAIGPDLVFPVGEMVVVVDPCGDIYIIGGNQRNGGIQAIQKINIASNNVKHIADMQHRRFVHHAVQLKNKNIFISGGFNNSEKFLNSTELFNPETLSITAGPTLYENMDNQRGVMLSNNYLFLEGGDNEKHGYIQNSELYNASNNTLARGPSLLIGRAMDSVNLDILGRVLIAGGIKIGKNDKVEFLKETEIFDPQKNTISPGPDMKTARKQHQGTTLKDGNILITGGINETGVLDSAELYISKENKFIPLPHMLYKRYEHSAILLQDGNVLITGGYDGSSYLDSAEIFDAKENKFFETDKMHFARAFHKSALLPNGTVIIVGGYDKNNTVTKVELYNSVLKNASK